MKRILHIVLVFLAAAACRGPRVIPKDTLTDIYTDMFLADQMVREMDIPHAQMDTLLLYEAVFEKYGYDTEDYLFSLRHYLKDPERFSKVFENVAKRLQGEVDALTKIIEHRDWVTSQLDAKRPLLDSILSPFSDESIFVGLARAERDTSRYPAWFRLVAVQEDTLMVSVDSLEARAARDTLKAAEPADPVETPVQTEEKKQSPARPPIEPPKGREKFRPHRLPKESSPVEAQEAVQEKAVSE